MFKLAILFISFIGSASLTMPQNIDITVSNNKNIDQISYEIEEKTITKPEALLPSYEIHNVNSDNILINDYFAPYYFSNLKGSFGNNVKGSCTYVAVDMLLSYYDSFWSDDFLPEKYDGNNVFVDDTVLNALKSPGSKREADIGTNPSI